MEQAKLGFRPKRSNYTREFFMESRYMHETYPEHYSPEKPFTRRRSPVKQPPLGSAPHVYKLMGSLYKEKEPEPEVEPQEPDFKSQVLSEAETSTKKVRSVSSKAQRTRTAIKGTIDECRELQHTFSAHIKSLNKTSRLAFLDSVGARDDFDLPLEWLEQEDNQYVKERFAHLKRQYET